MMLPNPYDFRQFCLCMSFYEHFYHYIAMNGIHSFKQKGLPFHFPFELPSPPWLLLKEIEEEQTVSHHALVPSRHKYATPTTVALCHCQSPFHLLATHPVLPVAIMAFSLSSPTPRCFYSITSQSLSSSPATPSAVIPWNESGNARCHRVKLSLPLPFPHLLLSPPSSLPLPALLCPTTKTRNNDLCRIVTSLQIILVWYMAQIKTPSYSSLLFVQIKGETALNNINVNCKTI